MQLRGGLVVVAALLTCSASVARAGTPELYGFGPRAIALAGAIEAAADGPRATWNNPAALGRLASAGGSLGLLQLAPSHRIVQLGGQQRYPAATPGPVTLGNLAVAAPIGGPFHERLGVGLALHIPLSSPTQIWSRDPRQPQVPLYEGLVDRLLVGLGLGWRVTDWLCVGLTGQLLAELSGGGDFRVSSLERRFTDQRLAVDLWSRLTFTAGATADLGPRWRLGVVFRQQADVRYRIPLTVRVAELGDVAMDVRGVGLWSPMSLALAARFTPTPRWSVLASARWERWSELPPLGPDVRIDVDNAALARNPEQAEQILSVQTSPVPLAAADRVVPRLGVEHRTARWLRLRGGLGWRATPLPRATGSANYLDADALDLGLGAGFALADPERVDVDRIGVDIAFGWSHLFRRTASKRDPTDPVGGTSLEGDELRFSIALRHAL